MRRRAPTILLASLAMGLVGAATPVFGQPNGSPVDADQWETVESIDAPSTQSWEEEEPIPIDWPTVLRLVRGQSIDIELAAEKVHQAQLELTMARQQWIPSIRVGGALLKHTGQIQDIPGAVFPTDKSAATAGSLAEFSVQPRKIAVDVLMAKQSVFARSGELDRATRETLLNASEAYIDLVAAQAGASISLEVANQIKKLIDRSEKLLDQGVGGRVDVLSNKSQYQNQLQVLNRARQAQLAASARLVQLLNMEAQTRLIAADEQLIPVMLVDENRPQQDLLAVAMAQGPGLSEAIALIATLEQQERRLRVVGLLPNINVGVAGGGFGGGFGGDLGNWGGRSDVGAALNWDVLQFIGNRPQNEMFASRKREARMRHDQIARMLSTGVIVALNDARNARERIKLAEEQVSLALSNYELSDKRLLAAETLSFEVLQSIGNLGEARKNYLDSVIEYNKAQVRLQYLIGYQPGQDVPEAIEAASPSVSAEGDRSVRTRRRKSK